MEIPGHHLAGLSVDHTYDGGGQQANVGNVVGRFRINYFGTSWWLFDNDKDNPEWP